MAAPLQQSVEKDVWGVVESGGSRAAHGRPSCGARASGGGVELGRLFQATLSVLFDSTEHPR